MKINRKISSVFFILSIILNIYFIMHQNTKLDISEKDTSDKRHFEFTGKFLFNDTINSLLNSFVKEVDNDSCFFEMIVDKRNTKETYIHLMASMAFPYKALDNKLAMNNYLTKNRPLLYMPIDNKKGFFIYTGIERLVDLEATNDDINFRTNKSSYFVRYWTIVLTDDKYLLYKNIYMDPFSVLNFDYRNQLKLKFK